MPVTPPIMPHQAIMTKSIMENSGTVPRHICHNSDDIWEHIIINKEYAAEVWIPNENITDKNMMFIGPPTIPRNEEKTPSTDPNSAATGKLRILNLCTLFLNSE